MVSLPFTQHGVSIDKSLARGNGETIQVATITSIHLATSYAMWWIPGVATGMAAFGAMLGGAGLLIIVVFAGVCAACFRLAAQRKTYNVVVTTAAGGQRIFAQTRDAVAAEQIRSALEAAISERG